MPAAGLDEGKDSENSEDAADAEDSKTAKDSKGAKGSKATKGAKAAKGSSAKASPDDGSQGPSVAAHPRAALHVARAKGWGGLLGFVLAGWLSLPTCTLATAGLRALIAGIACYLAAWAGTMFVWRYVVMLQLSRARAPRARALSLAPPLAGGARPVGSPATRAGRVGGAETAAARARAASPPVAQAVAAPADPAPSGAAAQSAGTAHQRANVRVQAQRPVIAYVGDERSEVLSYTLDLSAGGMLLAGMDHLEPGELLEFELTLEPDDPVVAGVATVVRSTPDGNCAVSFKSMGDEDERRLVKWVFDYQRTEQPAA
jgi:PilZ domain